MRTVIKLVVLGALLLPVSCFASDAALIAHRDSAASAINSADLVKLLKSDSPKWPDGTRMVIILGDPASVESRVLLTKIFRVAEPDTAAFLDTHKDSFLILRSEDMVLKAVASRPGAIGIVNVYAINAAVKVLRVDGKLPLEPGYLLHGN
jgi:hypothetical protein